MRKKCTPRVRQPDGYRLAEEIIARSVADNWRVAKREWSLGYVYISDEPGTCLCGHRPIFEHCVIVNRLNGNEAVVGSVCVKRFLGIPSDKLFAAIGRIAADPSRSLNAEIIEYAHDKGWVNDWEREFYLDTMRRRRLSRAQREKRVEINRQVLSWFERQGPPTP